jgi:hypothetical protein
MNFSTHRKIPRTPQNPCYHRRNEQPWRHVLLGLTQHCSESNTIRTSYTGTFGTYCGCLRIQGPLEDPATQRSVTVKSAQTATEIRNTPFSTGKVHGINTCAKMQTYRRVSYVTSASSTLERLELDYLLWFPTSVQYWRAYVNTKYGLSRIRLTRTLYVIKSRTSQRNYRLILKYTHCKEILFWTHRKCVSVCLKRKIPLTGRKTQLLKAVDVCVVNIRAVQH